VDDGIIAGNKTMMRSTIDGLNKVFKVKVQETIKDFLGCNIGEDFGTITLGQSRIMEKPRRKSNGSHHWLQAFFCCLTKALCQDY
jgi:hypothetical protein